MMIRCAVNGEVKGVRERGGKQEREMGNMCYIRVLCKTFELQTPISPFLSSL
jgi:hypothetical protein